MASTTTHSASHSADHVAARTLGRVVARVLLPVLLAAALVAVLVYAVFPTRTWLDQRAAIAQREADLAELDAANDALTERVARLGTAAEIERLARRDLGLVKPGEEVYAILPPAPASVRIPDAWPFTELAGALDP